MAALYPTNRLVSVFGQDVVWPGVDPVTGKFTNGSFSDPQVKPSFIPAETINLILDNLGNLITYLGFDSNNSDPEQLVKAVHAARPIGELRFFDLEPTPLQLVKWRCLPACGQIERISKYQDLCDVKYCGDANNALADWWYKTSDPEGLIRDINGEFMRIIDHRGVFVRPAGRNSLYTMADDTPYDGMSIGSFIPDAMQAHRISIYNSNGTGYPLPDGYLTAQVGQYPAQGHIGNMLGVLLASTAGDLRLAAETRGASVSVYACITY